MEDDLSKCEFSLASWWLKASEIMSKLGEADELVEAGSRDAREVIPRTSTWTLKPSNLATNGYTVSAHEVVARAATRADSIRELTDNGNPAALYMVRLVGNPTERLTRPQLKLDHATISQLVKMDVGINISEYEWDASIPPSEEGPDFRGVVSQRVALLLRANNLSQRALPSDLMTEANLDEYLCSLTDDLGDDRVVWGAQLGSSERVDSQIMLEMPPVRFARIAKTIRNLNQQGYAPVFVVCRHFQLEEIDDDPENDGSGSIGALSLVFDRPLLTWLVGLGASIELWESGTL